MAAGVVLALINLTRPNLTPLRLGARAMIDAAASILIFLTLGAHSGEIGAAWSAMTGGAAGPAQLAAVRDWSLALILGIIAAACLYSCLRGIIRIIRWQALKSSRPRESWR